MFLKYCSLYAFQIEFFLLKPLKKKKRRKVKLLQNLNSPRVICICYDFFIIY